MKTKFFFTAAVLFVGTSIASAQPAAAPAPAPITGEIPVSAAGRPAGRPPAPTRDPLAPGFVTFSELPDGEVPPMEAGGNFIIGPTHRPAAEMSPVAEGEPKGTIHRFTLRSTESKFYPGIARVPPAPGESAPAGANPNTIVTQPQPWTRTVSVYVPAQYVPGTVAPFMVTSDGDSRAFNVLDHLIPQKKLPVMIVIAIPSGGGDGRGSQRGLEYDTMSGKYGEFVETEVLPMAEKVANVKLTKDPNGRAVAGTSSGAAAGMIMAWFHPDRYRRVLTFSGTFVNQQWPTDPEYPHGAWGLHETLIPASPAKPLRIYLEVGDSDNYNAQDPMRDWVQANNHMARVLAAKGYPYKFVFARGAGHTHRPTISQLYPTALQWIWQGYPIEGK
ncbi:MAG TPA: alpha/beta hydrolase-fold protein [Opitutaceae bacterium]|nr:alpha/beta hydrolase-fold protein [Opitutaceae bacterium]